MIKVLFIPEEEESAVYQDIADILDMSSKTNDVPEKLSHFYYGAFSSVLIMLSLSLCKDSN